MSKVRLFTPILVFNFNTKLCLCPAENSLGRSFFFLFENRVYTCLLMKGFYEGIKLCSVANSLIIL